VTMIERRNELLNTLEDRPTMVGEGRIIIEPGIMPLQVNYSNGYENPDDEPSLV
jgi:hypothetical protein